MSAGETRVWGYWTQAKLRILEEYLARFLLASQNLSERVYIDAFAGEGRGRDRDTLEEFSGSARIALNVSAGGGFTRYRFFEQAHKATKLEDTLRSEYPGRDIRVFGGDCNAALPQALEELRSIKWAPTFAFIDPDGMEFEWSSMERLARHKLGYRSATSDKPEFKVELWLLFPTPGLMRTLALRRDLTDDEVRRATRLFGVPDWMAIHEDRREELLTGAEARDAYLNLMRWRLEKSLGYRTTHPLEVKNTRAQPLYHMIFATDNAAGERIMSSLYSKAAQEMPEMQREARDREQGQPSFHFDVPVGGLVPTYKYEPPWRPNIEGY